LTKIAEQSAEETQIQVELAQKQATIAEQSAEETQIQVQLSKRAQE
jgi:hypothetical protein